MFVWSGMVIYGGVIEECEGMVWDMISLWVVSCFGFLVDDCFGLMLDVEEDGRFCFILFGRVWLILGLDSC